MQRHARAISRYSPAIVFPKELPQRGLFAGKDDPKMTGQFKDASRKLAGLALIGAAVFAVAGCGGSSGSFDVDDSPQTKWSNLMALVQFKPLPNQPKPYDTIACPEIAILDGTSDDRVYAPGDDQSNASVRYQFSIGDVARDCAISGGQISLKVGVSGRILLGPAGSPGTFAAPIRVAVIRRSDEEPVLSKLYQVPTNIAPGQTESPFTLVTDPLSVPVTGKHFKEDYMIKVGFDSAGNGKKKVPAETASTDTGTPSPPSSDTAPTHHRARKGFLGGDQ